MRTQSLFHFTKSKDVLQLILENGFWPRYCFEDISWIEDNDFVGVPMVCFCDIPLSKLQKHTDFYGRFGIGMKREWGITNGLNPLTYITEQSSLNGSLRGMMANPADDDSKTYAMITLGHCKPLSGRMVINDEQISKNFYEECEWRFVDISEGFIFPEEINSSSDIELHNKKTVSNSLQFEPDDIRYILVETEDDVAEIVDFINTKLGRFTHDQLKRLITRIVVLNDLELDI